MPSLTPPDLLPALDNQEAPAADRAKGKGKEEDDQENRQEYRLFQQEKKESKPSMGTLGEMLAAKLKR